MLALESQYVTEKFGGAPMLELRLIVVNNKRLRRAQHPNAGRNIQQEREREREREKQLKTVIYCTNYFI